MQYYTYLIRYNLLLNLVFFHAVSFGILAKPQGSVLGPLLFLIYINDFQRCSSKLDFHLFADDSNLFYASKNLSGIESIINAELVHVKTWLSANKLSLNIANSNFVIFHPPQKKKTFNIRLSVNDKPLKEEPYIQYLGLMLDSHLNWKAHVSHVMKKTKRNIGLISKLRYFVNTNTLVSLYYALIYPFFIYSLIAWGNTYESNVRPLFILQKRAIRIITFSSFTEHTSPIFKSLKIVKCFDIVKLITSVFMYKFHRKLLPSIFSNFFTPVRNVHNYNTRLASKSSFVLPSARTNYRIFSLKFQGPKTWNSIDESLKSCSISAFKKKTQKSLYQPILNNLFLFLALTNTPIYPTSYIFCVCVRVSVCLSVYVCVPACLTDPIITPFNYITLN